MCRLANVAPIQIISPTTANPIRVQEGVRASVELVVSPSVNGVVPPNLAAHHFTVVVGGRPTVVQAPIFATDRYRLPIVIEPGLAVGTHDIVVSFGGNDTVFDGLQITAAAQPRPVERNAAASLGTLVQGATATASATVSAGADETIFRLDWAGSDVDLTLRAPSGRVITESTLAADVTVTHGPNFVTIRLTGPEAGAWVLEAFGRDLPTGEEVTYSVTEPNVPIRSDLTLANSGGAGTPISISLGVGSPLGGIPDSTVYATVTDPVGTVRTYPLADGGGAADTTANDGIYAALAWSTPVAGTYRVRVDAAGTDAAGLPWTRVEEAEITLGARVDGDGDGLANGAELLLGLNPADPSDASRDVDGDGLSWLAEVSASTSPFMSDTDGGGEVDSTEVGSGRDPLNPLDDAGIPAPYVGGQAVDGRSVHLVIQTADGTGTVVVDRIGPAGTVRVGSFTSSPTPVVDGPLAAGSYRYQAYVVLNGARSAAIDVGPFIVADDATDPHGTIVLNDGAWQTTDRSVTVRLVDLTEPVSSMRLALSEAALSSAAWIPFEDSTTVELAAQLGDQRVYAQVRDASGRSSLVLSDVIELTLLDVTAPTSSAGPLPAVVSDPVLSVPYTATDAGSGVFIVELWQRERSGPTAPWSAWHLARSANESPIVVDLPAPGEYEFYTVAIDETGNREVPPAVADAATRFSTGDTTPPSVPTGLSATAVAWNSHQSDLDGRNGRRRGHPLRDPSRRNADRRRQRLGDDVRRPVRCAVHDVLLHGQCA